MVEALKGLVQSDVKLKSMYRRLWFLSAGLFFLLPGFCLAEEVFQTPDGRFQIQVPTGWEVSQEGGESECTSLRQVNEVYPKVTIYRKKPGDGEKLIETLLTVYVKEGGGRRYPDQMVKVEGRNRGVTHWKDGNDYLEEVVVNIPLDGQDFVLMGSMSVHRRQPSDLSAILKVISSFQVLESPSPAATPAPSETPDPELDF